MTFVKSRNTKSGVSRSQAELERILRRYGATGLMLSSDWDTRTARVAFRVPDSPGSATLVPVRLEVSLRQIAQALYETTNLTQHAWEQCERVAWRHLVLWVDAACSAAAAGMQTMSEAFLAHTLVKAPDGSVKKISVLLDEVAKLEGHSLGYRGMLPA